jgi:hypothetical protein
MRKAIFAVLLLVLAACGQKQLEIEPIPEDPNCNKTLPDGIMEVGTFDYGPAAANLAVSAELELDGDRIKKDDIGLDLQVYSAKDRQTLVRNYSDGYTITVQWANGCVVTIASTPGQHGITGSYSSGTAQLYRAVV